MSAAPSCPYWVYIEHGPDGPDANWRYTRHAIRVPVISHTEQTMIVNLEQAEEARCFEDSKHGPAWAPASLPVLFCKKQRIALRKSGNSNRILWWRYWEWSTAPVVWIAEWSPLEMLRRQEKIRWFEHLSACRDGGYFDGDVARLAIERTTLYVDAVERWRQTINQVRQ